MTKKPKLIVLDTMNFWMDNCWDDLIEALKSVDVLTINDEEAQQLSGKQSLVAAAKKIKTMGPKYLIIKKENTGHCYLEKKKYFLRLPFHLKTYMTPLGLEIRLQGDLLVI